MHTLRATPDFPFLSGDNHAITSPETPEYNCIGWAAGEDDRFWWPRNEPPYYWPISPVPAATVEAFVEAFATLGYEPCEDGELEPDFEKVVLYVGINDIPTHMARQLPDGEWSSKLGSSFDIRHTTPSVINGYQYGKAHLYLKRPSLRNNIIGADQHAHRTGLLRIGRNDPCPCGSGKKFKQCHGKLA